MELGSVHFSHSVVSNSLWPHEPHHTRPPCPSPTPGVHSDSHPLSRWCHPAISSSVIPVSSCPQSLPASESFLMSQLFAWGGQSTGVLASASFPPRKSQGWSPSEWTGWISLQSKGLSSLLQHHSSKASILQCSAFFKVQLSHPYMSTATQYVCISYLFYTELCIYINLPIHPMPNFPFGIHTSVLFVCVSSALQVRSSLPFSRFHMYALIDNICFSLSDFTLYDSL